jgi:hemerythrin-like domain-containing protein
MIALVERNTALLEAGRFQDWQFFLDAVDFIRNYADRFHHAKEEDVLFVELARNGMPEKRSPIEAMHIEHEQGRDHVRAIEAATKQALAGEKGREAIIAEHAKAYAALLRGHIEKEDAILYPLSERVLPGEIRERMLQAYAEAEAKTPGLEEKYRQIVAKYELPCAA